MSQKLRLTSIIIFSCFLSLFSQNQIKVKILNTENNEPISYATVRFQGTTRGIVADYDGQFRLPFKDISSLPNLLITAIGFNDLAVNIKKLNVNALNILKLAPQTEQLDVVILNITKNDSQKSKKINELIKEKRRLTAKTIVERAVRSIPLNLDNNPNSVVGYYRDYQLVKDKYYNLNEGVLEQFDAGISTDKTMYKDNQYVFYSLKKNPEFATSKYYALIYNNEKDFTKDFEGQRKYIENAELINFGGNELSILNIHNPIRNFNIKTFSYVYRLNKDFLLNHNFKKEDIVFDGDDPLLNISFNNLRVQKSGYLVEKKEVEEFSASGIITISLKDYAIHNFKYKMLDYNKKNPLFNVAIEYKRHYGKMYLNYITFNNHFIVGEDFKFKEDKIVYFPEEKFFEITFNNEVERKTLKKKRFSIKMKDKTIPIDYIEIPKPKIVRVYIENLNNSFNGSINSVTGDFVFEIKNLKDIDGRLIYEQDIIEIYQFREFFTQEIFKNKKLDKSLKFVNKVEPIFNTQTNELINKDPYIINSPLQKRKMKSD